MATLRCAAHPGRPAVSPCPVCERPRCGADAALAPGGGCLICEGGSPAAKRVPPTLRELQLRAVLAASAASVGWGYVTAEYVGADLFKYLSPAVLGVLAGGAAQAAAANPGRSPLGTFVRVVAVVYAVLGAALGFLLEGTYVPLTAKADVLVPYGIAALAAWVWTAPPGKKPAKAS